MGCFSSLRRMDDTKCRLRSMCLMLERREITVRKRKGDAYFDIPLSRDRDLGLERWDCNPPLPFICRLEGQAQRDLLNQRRVGLVSDRPKPVAGVDRAIGQERRSGIRRTILNMVEQVEGLPTELEDHAFAEMQREVLIHR